VALPATVVLAFLFTAGRSTNTHNNASVEHSAEPLPAVTVPAPPTPDDATLNACTKVFAALPVQLGPLTPRRTATDSAFVAAWGDPAVVLSCGVSRPPELVPASAALIIRINDVDWLPRQQADSTVFTTVDRSVYLQLTVPKKQPTDPTPLLSTAVKALPRVCDTAGTTGSDATLPLCTQRS
jgi:hypothetical protein